MRRRLVEVATARSGDKGDAVDLSLFADDHATYELLRVTVTAARVRQHFAGTVRGDVLRYDLPRLMALKFVLHQALEGGAAGSPRADNLGKNFGAALLRMEVDWPDGPQAQSREGEG